MISYNILQKRLIFQKYKKMFSRKIRHVAIRSGSIRWISIRFDASIYIFRTSFSNHLIWDFFNFYQNYLRLFYRQRKITSGRGFKFLPRTVFIVWVLLKYWEYRENQKNFGIWRRLFDFMTLNSSLNMRQGNHVQYKKAQTTE